MRGDQRPGARLYCPKCSGEFVVEAEPDGKARAIYNGRHGTARELEPESDNTLIAKIVREASAAIAATSH
jgi:hypothetical protein